MQKNIPLTFVLFGATGDLAQKKIMPALLSLYIQKKMPEQTNIIAFSRRAWSDEDYRTFIKPSLEIKKIFSEEQIQSFLKKITYIQGTFDNPDSYKNLPATPNTIFHLAIQPEFYELTFKGLGEAGFTDSKIIIEKPFGRDTASALHLQEVLSSFFKEEHIYRIDHYLGKPGVQDILSARKNDADFEKRLNSEYVSSISIKMHEHIDIQGRGEFYETIGALRDVGQNHVLQMLSLIAMDLPDNAHSVSEARAKIVEDIKPLDLENIQKSIVRAQYEGYKQELDVAANSKTETFFSITLTIKNARWEGVSFILEGGKALPKKESTITIHFKDGTERVFNFEGKSDRDAYEVLIEQTIQDDQTWFVSNKEVIDSWRFITPIIEHLKETELKIYKKNTYPLA